MISKCLNSKSKAEALTGNLHIVHSQVGWAGPLLNLLCLYSPFRCFGIKMFATFSIHCSRFTFARRNVRKSNQNRVTDEKRSSNFNSEKIFFVFKIVDDQTRRNAQWSKFRSSIKQIVKLSRMTHVYSEVCFWNIYPKLILSPMIEAHEYLIVASLFQDRFLVLTIPWAERLKFK